MGTCHGQRMSARGMALRLEGLDAGARSCHAATVGAALFAWPQGYRRHIMLIFKILTAEQWQQFEHDGTFEGAPVDRTDGFVHFSTAAQVRETAAKHFGGQAGLMLVACDTDSLDDALRWEPSRGGDLFPHLYREMLLAEVLWAKPLPLAPGGHDFPAETFA
jgi:uncharacterized protein (DUF952 family)